MKQGESGFTVVSLIVAVAISVIIAAGAGMTTVQVIKVSQLSSDWAMAIRQAQNVGYWVSRDILMAQTVTSGDDSETGDVEFISLYWKDWETGDTYDVRYLWLDSDDSLKKLKRKQLMCDREGQEISNKTTLVADNIYAADVTYQDEIWKLSVRTCSGERNLTKEYRICQRLEQ